jgi:uncharacterized membrane protein
LQFLPVLRHKVILFHRINGYAIIFLVLVSHSGALMIAPIAFGGTLSTQLAVGVLVITTSLSLLLAWINIKRLQIDQHRKWMLRAWFYVSIKSHFSFLPIKLTSEALSSRPSSRSGLFWSSQSSSSPQSDLTTMRCPARRSSAS